MGVRLAAVLPSGVRARVRTRDGVRNRGGIRNGVGLGLGMGDGSGLAAARASGGKGGRVPRAA